MPLTIARVLVVAAHPRANGCPAGPFQTMSDTTNLAAAPLDPLVQRYLEYVRVEKRLADRTLMLYTLDLQKLKSHADAAGVALDQVQSSHIRRWVAQMHSGGRSGRGIALILSGWRGFYTWLGRAGQVACNPVLDVRAPKAAKPLPKALNVDDAVQLASFQAPAPDPWLEARDAAMVELLYDGGLRLAELTGLDVFASNSARGWVDLQAAEAHVLGKGSKRRIVPVGPKAVQALHTWLALRDQVLVALPANLLAADAMRAGAAENDTATLLADQRALFIGQRGTRLTPQSVWQRLRTRSLQAGMAAPVHPHMLRHSFASHVLQSSSDLRGVQELLGHANISTTQIYTRLDFGHLAKAYDSAHPRAHLKPGSSK